MCLVSGLSQGGAAQTGAISNGQARGPGGSKNSGVDRDLTTLTRNGVRGLAIPQRRQFGPLQDVGTLPLVGGNTYG